MFKEILSAWILFQLLFIWIACWNIFTDVNNCSYEVIPSPTQENYILLGILFPLAIFIDKENIVSQDYNQKECLEKLSSRLTK